MVGFPPLKLADGENPRNPPVPSGTPNALKFALGNPPAPPAISFKIVGARKFLFATANISSAAQDAHIGQTVKVCISNRVSDTSTRESRYAFGSMCLSTRCAFGSMCPLRDKKKTCKIRARGSAGVGYENPRCSPVRNGEPLTTTRIRITFCENNVRLIHRKRAVLGRGNPQKSKIRPQSNGRVGSHEARATDGRLYNENFILSIRQQKTALRRFFVLFQLI